MNQSVREVGWRLRPYREADLEPALIVWERAWRHTLPEIDFAARLPWWRARWVNEMLPVGEVMVADSQEGKLAGFLVLTPATGYIDQIVVDPDEWGSGLAARFMEYAKVRCPGGLDLHVNQANVRALAFYRRQGFVVAATAQNPRSGLPTFHMRRDQQPD